MKRFEHPQKPVNYQVKRAYLTRPTGLTGKRLSAWNRLMARLGYLEAIQ